MRQISAIKVGHLNKIKIIILHSNLLFLFHKFIPLNKVTLLS